MAFHFRAALAAIALPLTFAGLASAQSDRTPTFPRTSDVNPQGWVLGERSLNDYQGEYESIQFGGVQYELKGTSIFAKRAHYKNRENLVGQVYVRNIAGRSTRQSMGTRESFHAFSAECAVFQSQYEPTPSGRWTPCNLFLQDSFMEDKVRVMRQLFIFPPHVPFGSPRIGHLNGTLVMRASPVVVPERRVTIAPPKAAGVGKGPPKPSATGLGKPPNPAARPSPRAPTKPGPVTAPQLIARPTITGDHYPPRALDNELEGRVTIELTIAPDGRASACSIVAADPPGVFNDISCRRWMVAGRFAPAKNAKGIAVEGKYRTQVIWSLPN